MRNDFDLAVIDEALNHKGIGYQVVPDDEVTDFWDHLYSFVEEKYGDRIPLQGDKGEARGSTAHWVTLPAGDGKRIVIKFNQGVVDLEIRGFADRFAEFDKLNADFLEKEKLYFRAVGKSLAIRQYVDVVDFHHSFEEQRAAVEKAFEVAEDMQGIALKIKLG